MTSSQDQRASHRFWEGHLCLSNHSCICLGELRVKRVQRSFRSPPSPNLQDYKEREREGLSTHSDIEKAEHT